MTQVKAILIDPFERTVTAIEITSTTDVKAHLRELHALIGTDEISMQMVPGRDCMWFDDNGMLRDWDKQAFCLAPFYPEPLANRLVITRYTNMGLDDEAAIDCQMDIDQLRQAIQWVAPKSVEVTAPYVVSLDTGEKSSLYGGPEVWTHKDHPSNPWES